MMGAATAGAISTSQIQHSSILAPQLCLYHQHTKKGDPAERKPEFKNTPTRHLPQALSVSASTHPTRTRRETPCLARCRAARSRRVCCNVTQLTELQHRSSVLGALPDAVNAPVGCAPVAIVPAAAGQENAPDTLWPELPAAKPASASRKPKSTQPRAPKAAASAVVDISSIVLDGEEFDQVPILDT